MQYEYILFFIKDYFSKLPVPYAMLSLIFQTTKDHIRFVDTYKSDNESRLIA